MSVITEHLETARFEATLVHDATDRALVNAQQNLIGMTKNRTVRRLMEFAVDLLMEAEREAALARDEAFDACQAHYRQIAAQGHTNAA